MKEARREIKIIAGAAFGLPALESKCHRNVLEQIQMNFKYFPISFRLHFPLFTFLLGRRRILTRRIISALLWGDSFQWGFPSQPASKWTQTEMISRFILLEWKNRRIKFSIKLRPTFPDNLVAFERKTLKPLMKCKIKIELTVTKSVLSLRLRDGAE